MNLKNDIKKITRWLAMLVAVALFLGSALFGLAQTTVCRQLTAKWISGILSEQGGRFIEVKGLRGLIPFDLQADLITCKDSAGQWLTLQGVNLHWAPLSLFKGIIHIKEVKIDLAQIDRLSQNPGKVASDAGWLPSMPLYFPRLQVDRFAAGRMTVGEAVLGKTADFSVEGKIMSTAPDGACFSFLDFHRTDGGVGKVVLRSNLSGQGSILAADIKIEEDEDGLIPFMLGIHHPITLNLHGQGPVRAWKANLTAGVGDIGDLAADIGMEIIDAVSLTAQGVFRPAAGHKFAQMSPWFGNEGRFSLGVRLLKTGVLRLDRMSLNAGGTDVKLSGNLDLKKEAIDGQFTVGCKDVGFLGPLMNIDCAGKIEGDQPSRLLTAHIQGQINVMSQAYPSLAPFAGKEIDCTGDLTLKEAKTLSFSNLRLDSGAWNFMADGSLDLADKMLDGTWRLMVPQLAGLSPALNRGLGGSLQMEGTAKGRPDHMALSVNALARDLIVEGVSFELASASFHSEGPLSNSQGKLKLEFDRAGIKAFGSAGFALKGYCLSFFPILVKAPGSQCHGNLTLYLDRNLAEGVLEAESKDISGLASLFGDKLNGSAEIKTQLTTMGDEQVVVFIVEARKLANEMGGLDRLSLNGKLKNPFAAPGGNLALDIKGLSFEDHSVDYLKFNAQGSVHDGAFNGIIKGNYNAAFQMEGSGRFSGLGESRTIELLKFRGQLAGSTLNLKAPAKISRTSTGVSVEDVAFDLGNGFLKGRGHMEDNVLDADLKFENIPLGVLQFAGMPELNGMATGHAYLRGKPSQPEGSIEFRLKDVCPHYSQARTGNVSTLEGRADLKGGRLVAELGLAELSGKPLKASMEMPVIFSVTPFVWSIPSQGSLTGTVAGGFSLCHVFPFMDIADQNLDGWMVLDLSLDGTTGDPVIKGRAHVTKGAYENIRTGTILKDAELDITVRDSMLIIERGLMSDGEGGTISFTGRVDLVPVKNFPFHAQFDLEKATLIRHDYATATAQGRLSVSGSLKEAMLMGQVNIVSAAVMIPNRLPPDATTELAVTDINQMGGEKQAPKATIPAKEHGLKLDVSVKSSGQVFIRGRGLESEWKGDLKLTGSASEPAIGGRLSVVRGSVNFLGKHFNLKQGLIDFHGAFPLAPSLDVQAESVSKGMTAYLKLSGPLTEPVIKLSSEPVLPKDEILSRLLFGRKITSITPAQAVQLAQAVNTMAGGGGFDFIERARRLVGADQLEVKPSENGIGDSAISAGKYLNEKVYMSVERSMQTESGKVSMEVELTPNITVGTEVKENSEGGVGVNWKWDY